MKKVIGVVVMIGIVASSGIALSKPEILPPAVAAWIDRMYPATDANLLAMSGNVEITEVDVGFTLAGRLQMMTAREGQTVQVGELLAQLENVELSTLVEQNRAILDEAEVRLVELKSGPRVQQVQQSEASVAAVAAELSKAKKDYARAEALYNDALIPISQLDAAKSAYKAAAARHQQALEQLSLTKEGSTKESIQAAAHKVTQAQAGLRIAEERLRNAQLTAPLTGVVLKRNAEVGEIIAQGAPIYTLGDLEHPWVKVYVQEDKLGLVKLGQSVAVRIDSFPDKAYAGTVTYISPEAEFTPKTVQTKEERVKLVFGVKVSVVNDNYELKPGMPADVQIAVN